MEIIEINESIFKFKIESHSEIKQKILNEIKSGGNHPLITNHSRISNQDYLIESEKRYMDILYPSIQNSLDILRCNYGVHLNIDNYWFQQYYTNDNHTYHTHSRCNYSSVYYVECPKGMATTFMLRDKVKEIDAEEGDYIIFPSTIPHCSKPNFTNQRKTAIAVNLNYQEN